MKVFMHNDPDGRCSAFIIHHYVYQDTLKPENFIEVAHGGKPFPMDTIEKDEEIWIVDYSIKPALMDELLKKTTNVIWIDHHGSAIKDYEDYPRTIRGIRFEGLAACVLTYIFAAKEQLVPNKKLTGNVLWEIEKDVPPFIRWIGDHDTWGDPETGEFRHEETKDFRVGMDTVDQHPLSSDWQQFVHPHFSAAKAKTVVEHGKVATRFRDNWAGNYRNNFSFSTEIDGYKVLAMNVGQCGSEFFGDELKNHDILMAFGWNGKKWQVSLYSDAKKVHVGEIAAKMGGGGHPRAAGFVMDEPPLNLQSFDFGQRHGVD